MEGEHLSSCRFHAATEFNGIDVGIIPTNTGFDGNRNLDCLLPTVLTMVSATSGCRRSDDPPPFLVILLTGQPMLMSMVLAPSAAAHLGCFSHKNQVGNQTVEC